MFIRSFFHYFFFYLFLSWALYVWSWVQIGSTPGLSIKYKSNPTRHPLMKPNQTHDCGLHPPIPSLHIHLNTLSFKIKIFSLLYDDIYTSQTHEIRHKENYQCCGVKFRYPKVQKEPERSQGESFHPFGMQQNPSETLAYLCFPLS